MAKPVPIFGKGLQTNVRQRSRYHLLLAMAVSSHYLRFIKPVQLGLTTISLKKHRQFFSQLLMLRKSATGATSRTITG